MHPPMISRCIVGLAVLALVATWPAAAQPTRPRDTVRGALPPDVRRHADLLYDADPGIRADAACELGRIGRAAQPAIPLLVAMLGDITETPAVECHMRRFAGYSMSVDQLDDRQWPTTPGRETARTLGELGTAAFEPTLAALDDSAPGVRMNAARALGMLDDGRAVAPLGRTLQDADARVREQSAGALGRLDDATALDGLVEALDDAAVEVRRTAAWALGRLDDSRAVNPLMSALDDADANVREQAAWALGRIDDSRGVPGLLGAIDDGAPAVREQVAWALGRLEDGRAIDALSALLTRPDPDGNVRE